ncbi:MAG: NYN domain-containing protein [Treponema sp.]|nr:NYN domain-containing protein [Treponema sp.]
MINKPNAVVFIDSDNFSSTQQVEQILSYLRDHFLISEVRAYGNFAMPQLSPWLTFASYKEAISLRTCGSKPQEADIMLSVEMMEYIARETSTDVTLVLISRDCDFVYVASAARRLHFKVLGIGCTNSRGKWKTACSQFVSIETIIQKENASEIAKKHTGTVYKVEEFRLFIREDNGAEYKHQFSDGITDSEGYLIEGGTVKTGDRIEFEVEIPFDASKKNRSEKTGIAHNGKIIRDDFSLFINRNKDEVIETKEGIIVSRKEGAKAPYYVVESEGKKYAIDCWSVLNEKGEKKPNLPNGYKITFTPEKTISTKYAGNGINAVIVERKAA